MRVGFRRDDAAGAEEIMTHHGFVKTLEDLSFQDAFNPYSECCAVCDCNGAARIRRDSLLKILIAATESGVDFLHGERDFGHRGGRRTGLPFTDDAHRDKHANRCPDKSCQRISASIFSPFPKFLLDNFFGNC